MRRLSLLLLVIIVSSSIALFGCSNNKKDNTSSKKESESKAKYSTIDYTLERATNTELGVFTGLKPEDSSNSYFYILKMDKSEFDIDKIREFAENKTVFKDYIITNLKIVFDDFTGLEISRGDGGDAEENGRIVISYSDLTPEYIDFFNKYEKLNDTSTIYKLPNDEITFLKDDKNYEFLFYENGIFTTEKSHFPVKEGSILYPLIK